jgi:hypothetical protein
MQVRTRFRIGAGGLACFAAGILIADTVYKLDGGVSPAIDLSIVSLVLTWIAVPMALKGWGKIREEPQEGTSDTAIKSPR